MESVFLLALWLSLVTALPSYKGNEWGALVLDEAPQSGRPYVLRKGSGQAVAVGSQIYRFSVTGNSSDGAFTLLQTNAATSSGLGVLPHIHKTHYENFYCTKGRVQLWAETDEAGQQARLLTQGDYGAVPHNTIHTFQILDPDTQLTGVIQPGGFEELFIAISNNAYNSSTGAEFVPSATDDSDSSGSNPDTISALESFDVYAKLDFEPRRDLVNGSAGGSLDWHIGTNSLATDSTTPNFIAKNYGPKHLNNLGGMYHIIAPLATEAQTSGNFSMGTVTMSPLLANSTAVGGTLHHPFAIQLEEGMIHLAIDGFDEIDLISGDVAFVPAGTPFKYSARAPATRFLYVSGGKGGFDQQLLENAVSWDFATYPTYAGYNI